MLNLRYYNKLFLLFSNNGIEYNIMSIDVRTNEYTTDSLEVIDIL